MKRVLKISVLAMLLALVVALFAVGASAADNVVFLQGGAKGSGASADDPCGTYGDALDALDLSKDGTVVICGPTTQTKVFNYGTAYTGSVTFTNVYDGVDYRETNDAVLNVGEARFVLCGETKFENIHINATGAWWYIIANHKPLTMGEGIDITGDGLKGGTFAKSIAILGGYQSGVNNPPAASNEDVNITLLSGRMYYVIPFNRSFAGDFTGTAYIHIGGNAHVNTLHGSSERDGSTVGNVKVTLTDNAVVDVFYGGTADVTLNSFELNWLGGTLGDIFDWNCRYTPTKTMTIIGETKLIASEKAQRRGNFTTIAAMFDTVEEYKVSEDSDTPAVPVVTDRTVVFLKDGAMGDGSSPENAVGSLIDAYEALDLTKDSTVVLCGPVSQTTAFDFGKEYAGSVTFTSVYGGVDYAKTANAAFNVGEVRFVMRGETTFENIIINATGKWWFIIAQHNPLTMGEGITVKGDLLKGGKFAQSIAILGGYQAGVGNPPLTDDNDVNVTLLSGRMYYVIPFNRGSAGTYTGTANIYIGGNAQVDTLHGSSERQDSVVGDTRVTLADKAYVKTFYGGTANVTLNSFTLTWIGGDMGAIFDWDCRYMNPPTTMTITNGTKLIASDSVKTTANYAAISAMFDTVEAYTGTTVQKPTVKSDYGCARGLYTLGLAQGYDSTGTNFGLTDKMTRVQTVVQVIRFLGVENEVKAGTFSHPFSDVPAWANNYVGYAYANNITKGVSAAKFGTDDVTTEAQFLTFMLRAIGYSDQGGDFVWSNPFALAKSIGMSEKDTASAAFLRGDAFRYSWNTLYATAKNGAPVYENLANAGVFTINDLDKAAEAALSAVEPAKPVTPATPAVKPQVPEDPTGYNVLSKADYYDKTLSGFMANIVGVLTGFEHVYQNGVPLVAMPEEWYKGLLRGPYAEANEHNKHADHLLYNEETQMWEVWTDDDYSIDMLNQYIIRDSYNTYGMISSDAISNAWVGYNQWDMGGGHRSYGAYGLAKNLGYIAPFTGKAEFGNLYSTIGEPIIECETLGMDAAGMPNVAYNLTAMFSNNTSDSDANVWAEFLSALYAMAYFEDDIPAMIRKAQKMMPENSYEYQLVDESFKLYEKYPNDWRAAVREADNVLLREHSMRERMSENSINGPIMIFGLLYGNGNYEETCKIIGLAGHGGESASASALGIVGVMQGWENLEANAKPIVNEYIWQDGKGVIVNLALPDVKQMYWMHAEELPERILIKDIVSMFQANFEKILVENGGYIEGDNYYIPKYRIHETQSVLFEDFEDGLGAFTAVGNAKISEANYSGKYAAQVNGGEGENSVYAKVSGLTVGAQYRISAYINATTKTTAHLFAREVGGKNMQFATVCSPARYSLRQVVFTATAETMEIGMQAAAGTGAFKYACLDDIIVERVVESEVASAAVAGTTGTVTVNVTGKHMNKGGTEAYLKVSFTNTAGTTVDVPVTLNGAAYATIPFYATGDSTGSLDATYIPIALAGDTSVVTLQCGAGVTVTGVTVVTVNDRF